MRHGGERLRGGNQAVSQPTEECVRGLRNNIYGPNPKYCTDDGWESTKANWMKPENVRWLEAQPQNQKKTP